MINIRSSIENTIDKTFLTFDSYNVLLDKNNNNEKVYLLNSNNNSVSIKKILELIKILLNKKINFDIISLSLTYYLVLVYDKDEIIMKISIYNMRIREFLDNVTEMYFDCNLLFRDYNNYNLFNLKYNYKLDELNNRRMNKKFCYLLDNMSYFDKFIEYEITHMDGLTNYDIINMMLYAKTKIEDGWIMDEYFKRDESWTLNYWVNYINFINIIKFREIEIENHNCAYCNNLFNNNDIVFNKSGIFVHYECIYSRLYN